MGIRSSDLCAGALEMTEQTDWPLQRIREAYSEILRAYNILFPLHADGKRGKKEEKVVLDAFDPEGNKFYKKAFFRKMREVSLKLKVAADQSGNAQTWHAGESLEGLNERMKERIDRALKFGI